MLINYDFYDIHAFIVFLRNNFGCTDFLPAIVDLKDIMEGWNRSNGIGSNTVRRLLRPYSEKYRNELLWVFTDNRYTANVYVIKEQACYETMSRIFREMLICCEKDFQRFCMLCDSVHNVPLYLVDEQSPKKAVACAVSDYRKKYSPDFLTEEMIRL